MHTFFQSDHLSAMDNKVVIIIGAAIFTVVVLGFVFRFLLFYQKRALAFKSEKQLIESKFKEELLQTQIEIQEQTFKTISQEIHDNIGQTLSLARFNLNRIDQSRLVETDGEKVLDAEELVGRAINDLRDLSRVLNTEKIAALGLLKALEIELNNLRKAGSIKTTLEVFGTPITLDPQKELILFRICQEALQNVIKHASATVIKVKATYTHQVCELVISDNGKGFETSSVNIFSSGLQNMESRARVVATTFDIRSSVNNGTQITLLIPLNN